MGKKVTTLYDFTLTANGSQQIQADANFYKILTASGDVSITRDGGSTVKPMRAGRGERNVQFLTLTIRDLSGAPNSGTILVGDSDFIDDTIVLSSAINIRPEAASGNFRSGSALAANTPEVVFNPGSNTGGAIIFTASYQDTGGSISTLIAKSGVPPASAFDGEVVAMSKLVTTGNYQNIDLQYPQFIAAGLGLYFINGGASSAPYGRACRYKLL